MLDLEPIKARCEKATPFDERMRQNRYEHGGGRMFRDGDAGDRSLVLDCYDEPDREFYFHAYQDVKTLLAEVERLRAGSAPAAPHRGLDDPPS